MSVIFIVFSCFLIYLQYRSEKNIINLISILIAPYVIIVFFNNFFFYNMGFYKVSDASMIVFLVAFFLFFVGGRVAMKTTRNVIITETITTINLEKYNTRRMKRVLSLIVLVGLIKLAYMISSGKFMANEGEMGFGLFGHLLLISYSITPFLVLNWTNNKKDWMSIILPLLTLMLAFSSFIKYHIIGHIIVIFLFLVINKKSLLKKALIILISVVIGVFVLNYMMGFAMKGLTAQSSFYVSHFWKYCAGALINSNHFHIGSISEEIGLLYKLMIYICALPNLFLSVLGIKIFSSDAFDFTNHFVSEYGQDSNVVDAITRLYPADGDVLEILLFAMFMLIIGFIFMRIYLKAKQKPLSVFLSVFLTFFVFLSFFGTFYMLSAPWEMLVWTLLIPKMFLKRSVLKRKYK